MVQRCTASSWPWTAEALHKSSRCKAGGRTCVIGSACLIPFRRTCCGQGLLKLDRAKAGGLASRGGRAEQEGQQRHQGELAHGAGRLVSCLVTSGSSSNAGTTCARSLECALAAAALPMALPRPAESWWSSLCLADRGLRTGEQPTCFPAAGWHDLAGRLEASRHGMSGQTLPQHITMPQLVDRQSPGSAYVAQHLKLTLSLDLQDAVCLRGCAWTHAQGPDQGRSKDDLLPVNLAASDWTGSVQTFLKELHSSASSTPPWEPEGSGLDMDGRLLTPFVFACLNAPRTLVKTCASVFGHCCSTGVLPEHLLVLLHDVIASDQGPLLWQTVRPAMVSGDAQASSCRLLLEPQTLVCARMPSFGLPLRSCTWQSSPRLRFRP